MMKESGNSYLPSSFKVVINNSTYDLKCRKCGEEPSCNYVAKHKQVIEQYLKNR